VVFSPTILAEPKPIQNKIIYWSVGQGDFISFISPHLCLIFDVGGSIKAPMGDLLLLRNSCPSRTVELYISHFDKDHISNYGRLLSYVTVKDAYFSHLDSKSRFGQKLLQALRDHGTKIHEIRKGYEADYKGIKLKCIWPPQGPLRKAENERSLVLRLEVRGHSLLFTGDLPTTMEKKITAEPVDILKVGHHGSRSSSSDRFLQMLKPKACVVSVGKVNTYGHPTKEALQRLNESHCTIFRTDTLGNITFEL
jgi:competence protein ComEC